MLVIIEGAWCSEFGDRLFRLHLLFEPITILNFSLRGARDLFCSLSSTRNSFCLSTGAVSSQHFAPDAFMEVSSFIGFAATSFFFFAAASAIWVTTPHKANNNKRRTENRILVAFRSTRSNPRLLLCVGDLRLLPRDLGQITSTTASAADLTLANRVHRCPIYPGAFTSFFLF